MFLVLYRVTNHMAGAPPPSLSETATYIYIYIIYIVKGQGTGRLQDHLCPATPATGLELTYSCERDKGALQLQFNFTW